VFIFERCLRYWNPVRLCVRVRFGVLSCVFVLAFEHLTLGVIYTIIILYIIILYITIIIYYILLLSSIFLSHSSSLSIFLPPVLFISSIITSPLPHSLTLPYLLLRPPLLLSSSICPPHLPLLSLHSQSSPLQSSTILTPHVLSEWMVEVCGPYLYVLLSGWVFWDSSLCR
jgi:hypothetical protein